MRNTKDTKTSQREVDAFVTARMPAHAKTPAAKVRRAAEARKLADERGLKQAHVRARLARATMNAKCAQAGRRRFDGDDDDDGAEPVMLPGMVETFEANARTASVLIDVPNGAMLDVDRLESNGVVTWAADLDELPIGKTTDLAKVDGGKLRVSFRFAASDLAEMVLASVKEGVANAAGLMCSRAPDGTLEAGALTLLAVAPDASDATEGDAPEETDEQRMRRLGITRRVNLNDPKGATALSTTQVQDPKEEKALAAQLAEDRPRFRSDATTDPIAAARATRDQIARDAWHKNTTRR